jgi:acetyl esterase/lipase
VCHEDVDDEEKKEQKEQEEEDGPGIGMDRTTIRLKRKNVIAVEKIHHTTKQTEQPETLSKKLSQRESNRAVSGYYLHNPTAAAHDEGSYNNDQTSHDDDCSDTSTRKVLFYLYGGAFLGGDAKGNVHYGIKLSQQCNMDVFIPQYGLLPEYHFLDALEDVIQAYAYLIETRGIHPKNVILFGISSGGGLVVRLLQRIVQVMSANSRSDKSIIVVDDRNRKHDDLLLQVPSGAVLMSPFVDYTTPKGSFKEYTVHDLVVNEVSESVEIAV